MRQVREFFEGEVNALGYLHANRASYHEVLIDMRH